MKVAIIPARGGSKRIKNKNIKTFCNKEIIGYSIEAIKKSALFDRIIVSTDCPSIGEIALKFGAEVPFLRPEDIANDFATTREVVAHAKQWLENDGCTISYICCIYATAPFITHNDLIASFELFSNTLDKQFCFSVTEFEYSPFRSFTIEDNYPQLLFPEHKQARSQDLVKIFHDAGQFYWSRINDDYRDEAMIDSKKTLVFPLPRYKVQDIDTLDDWQRAEAMYYALKTKNLV
ncbi:MAG: pseudaminic acid cytidylyltransferase [Paraglaciecola sp.]|jgi:pseudaminic acid cytidylyltransferase